MFWSIIHLPLALVAISATNLRGADPAPHLGTREPASLWAQDADAPRAPVPAMALSEALQYARAHQPTLAAAQARLAASLADAAVPGAAYYPRLGLTAQAFEATTNNTTATYLGVAPVDLPRIGATRVDTRTWSPAASTIAALGLRQEIFDFGRIAAQEAVASAAVDAERGRADAARLDVDFSVENAFYVVLTAKGLRDVADSALQRSKLNHDTAAAGVAAQLRDPIELTRADADLARFQVARERAEDGLATAQAAFAAVVGVPDPLLDASGSASQPRPAPTPADALAQALANDPGLHERRALLARQEASTRSLAAELRPDLSLSSTVSGRGGDALPSSGVPGADGTWRPDVPNWDVGLVLTWPLFDQGVRAREAASGALEQARSAEIEEREQQLRARVQRAYLDFEAARRALPALEKSRAVAGANYEQAEARFKADLGSSTELADAQAVLAEAEGAVTVGHYDVSRARALLGRVVAEER